jgi:hypothetical protein
MNGGPAAKNAYRYQDWCAMYFLLKSLQNNSFEHIYCEQEKLDFEIWSESSFTGFQVKTNPAGLTAEETNRILLFYLNKAINSGRRIKSFRFIFGQRPVKSIGHLFAKIRGDSRGIRYSKQVQNFINRALQDISINSFSINYHNYDQIHIRASVYSISRDILINKLEKSEDIQSKVVDDFIAILRNEIDKISCKMQNEERIYLKADVDLLVRSFLDRVKIERLKKEGLDSEIIRSQESPTKQQFQIPATINEISTAQIIDISEGEPIK